MTRFLTLNFLLLLPNFNVIAKDVSLDTYVNKECSTVLNARSQPTSSLIDNGYTGFAYQMLGDGGKIAGQFVNGKINGYGMRYYPSGEKYLGQFKNGEKEGEGLLFSSTQIISGVWEADNYKSINTNKSKGCKSEKCKDGKGVYIYEDYTLYDGEFIEGKANGFGICYYADGDIYVGFWNEYKLHGEGTYYYNDGRVLTGSWENGNFLKENTAEHEVFAPKSVYSELSEKTTHGKIWAIVIGVAKYSQMPTLNYTDDDAYQLYGFLKSPEGGAVKDEQIKLLIDENATKDNIMKALKDFAGKVKSEDSFIFYFSGHGLPGSFLPIDSDGLENQLAYNDLLNILQGSKAKSKIIIADACHSGSLASFKGVDYQSAMDNYYNAIHESKGGLVMIMSSSAEEKSIENNGLRQGIFSYFLLRGLKGAANTNNDSIIRVNELFDYVQNNVSFYTNQYQTPMIYGDNAIDHPIALIRED